MTTTTLYWHIFQINRKSGEPKAFPTLADLQAHLVANPANVKLEATNHQKGFTGYMMDAPDGDYLIKGPNFRREEWTATLTVAQGQPTPYSAA